MSVTDESLVDGTGIWQKYKISILVYMMSLFIGVRLLNQHWLESEV